MHICRGSRQIFGISGRRGAGAQRGARADRLSDCPSTPPSIGCLSRNTPCPKLSCAVQWQNLSYWTITLKKPKGWSFVNVEKKNFKSISSPTFWELIKISPVLHTETCSIFFSSASNCLPPAFALRFAHGGGTREDTRNLAGERTARKLSREYPEVACFTLQIHRK